MPDLTGTHSASVIFAVRVRRGSITTTSPPRSLTARIRFDHDASRWAREFFPATEIEEAEDGSAIATVRTSGRFWLVSELLLWGGRATVLEPDDLRREVADRARETLLQYGGEG